MAQTDTPNTKANGKASPKKAAKSPKKAPEDKHLEEVDVLRIELARANHEKLMLASGNLRLAAQVRELELQNVTMRNNAKAIDDQATQARIEGMSANASQKLEAVQKEIGEKYDLGKGKFTYDLETRKITVTENKDVPS